MTTTLAKIRSSRYARPALAAGAFIALFGVTRFFPNPGGGSGSPAGVVFQGLVYGGLFAMLAVGMVLVYRTSRVVNFAQAALGVAGAVFTANFVTVYHWPYGLSFIAAILVSGVLACACELLLRRFFDAPRLVVTIATIGVMGLLATLSDVIPFLPLWSNDSRSVQQIFTPTVTPLRHFHFRIDSSYQFGFAFLLALIVAPLSLAAVGWFLTRTKTGAAVRAVAENVERAEMLGINARLLSTLVWTIAGALGGIAITLYMTTTSFATGAFSSVEALLPALAAAVIASFSSIPAAICAAVGLEILHETMAWSFPGTADPIFAVVLLLIIAGGPLLMKRLRGRDREVSSWEAAEELRPVPKEMNVVAEVRTWRRALIGVGSIAVLLFPWLVSVTPTSRATEAAIVGIVMLSLIVLTGWTGQVSLGHWGLVAVAALVGGALIGKLHLSFWLALPLAAIVTSLFAALIGLPALRIRGLMLAVTTFAFSFVVYLVFFNPHWFGWLMPDSVNRPTLFLLNFDEPRSMYYLAVAFLALCFVLIAVLRRGRPGRILLALRENEDNLITAGINPTLTRLSAFMLSGFLCGIAGVLFAVQQRAVTQTTFQPVESLNIFLFAVIGGLGAPAGAILGTLMRVLYVSAPSDPFLGFFLNPSFGVLVVLYLAPRGLAGLMQSMRDSVLRIIAQRRGIAAPTLFADMDVEAIEKRLVLVSEPIEGRGIASLKRRYGMESEIHSVRTGNGAHASDERVALAAAAAMLERAPGTVLTRTESDASDGSREEAQ